MCNVRGVGIDLSSVNLMEELLDNERWLNRCFTQQEAAYIRSRGSAAAESMAGLWCAKEAALKALGTGLALSLTDIEILHRASGQPYYRLHGKALEAAQGGAMHLSISHDGGMAIAICVWESGISCGEDTR